MVTNIVQKSNVDISKRACKPGVTAVQLRLHPVQPVPLPSVLNTSLTIMVLVVMGAGREEPQLFSIKVVPSPSRIVRWSQKQSGLDSMSNAVNCNDRMSPSSTCSTSVLLTLSG